MAKWRKRTTTTDAPIGPKAAPTVLTAEEAIAVAFRSHTLPPLDDCLCALHETILHLSRSAALLLSTPRRELPPSEEGQATPKQKKAEIQGLGHWLPARRFCRSAHRRKSQCRFVFIDRTRKVAFAELHPQAKRLVAADFLRRVLEKLPFKVPTVLTDIGVPSPCRRIHSSLADTAWTGYAASSGWSIA